ncbi:hypothetical protein PISMIDRAFT_687949, partial [Pisolithus microcarpus 441]
MRGYKQEPAGSYNLRGLSLSRSSVVTSITRAANDNYAPECASANKRSTSTMVVSSPNMPQLLAGRHKDGTTSKQTLAIGLEAYRT